jgi:hypothetical protein
MKPTQLAAGALALAELTKSAFVTPPSVSGELKADKGTTISSHTPMAMAVERLRNHASAPGASSKNSEALLKQIGDAYGAGGALSHAPAGLGFDDANAWGAGLPLGRYFRYAGKPR